MENDKVNFSKELLLPTGHKSRKDFIKSLLKETSASRGNKEKLETFKVNKSPIFDQIRNFLPEMKVSTSLLMSKSEEEREDMNIENVEGCKEVVEMNLLVGVPDINDDSETCSDSDSYSLDSDSESVANELSHNESSLCPFSKKRKQISLTEPVTDSKITKKKLIVEINSDDNNLSSPEPAN